MVNSQEIRFSKEIKHRKLLFGISKLAVECRPKKDIGQPKTKVNHSCGRNCQLIHRAVLSDSSSNLVTFTYNYLFAALSSKALYECKGLISEARLLDKYKKKYFLALYW